MASSPELDALHSQFVELLHQENLTPADIRRLDSILDLMVDTRRQERVQKG